MIRNYFKIAWRNIIRHKVYSSINIAGLAVGIAACLLLFVIVRFEWSYDRFQSKGDRIYRVVTQGKYADGITLTSGIPIPAADALRQDFPDTRVTSMLTNPGSQLAVSGNMTNKDGQSVQSAKKFIEESGVFFLEPPFFDLFDSKWLAGSPSSLAYPDMVVLSRSEAIKCFGDWTLAMGQILKMDNDGNLQKYFTAKHSPPNNRYTRAHITSKTTLLTLSLIGVLIIIMASIGNIVYLFSREFTLLIGMAFGIAIPIAWFMMNNWLNNFAYRITLQAGIFVIAILLSVGIAWLTVGYKAVRAALADPVRQPASGIIRQSEW